MEEYLKMKTVALRTSHIIKSGEDLFETICKTLAFNKIQLLEDSILVLAETVVATCQKRIVQLKDVKTISETAQSLAEEYEMDPRFVELIVQEADEIIGGIPAMLFTEKNEVMIANAGIDKSNSGPEGYYSLWPTQPFETADILRKKLCEKFQLDRLGIIISDSRVQPRRRGVVGVAIGVAGFNPIIDCRGKFDLYGHKMEFTTRAIADQLTDVAHVVMGECDEQTPFVLIENAPVEFTDALIDRDAMIMSKKEDLFFRIFQNR